MSAKIYLAKSNKANPNIVMDVREKLSKYNLDVVEYSGGGYTHKDLKTCDYLIVIPDMKNVTLYNANKSSVLIGNGLLEQIDVFSGQNSSQIGVILDSYLTIGLCNETTVIDSTDYINYGKLFTNKKPISFDTYMANTLKIAKKEYIITQNKLDIHLSIML